MFSLIEDSLIIIISMMVTLFIVFRVGTKMGTALRRKYLEKHRKLGRFKIENSIHSSLRMYQNFQEARREGRLSAEEIAHGACKADFSRKYDIHEAVRLRNQGRM